METLKGLKRTHNCNTLNKSNIGDEVVLFGWVDRRRDHGGVIFVDLRDKYGKTQVVFNPEINPEVHKKAEGIRNEFVLAVKAAVQARPDGMINEKLGTGEIEVMVSELRILNESLPPPILINESSDEGEEVKLKYRYLELRRPWVQDIIHFRHQVTSLVRDYLNGLDFTEIETPILMKSTPEGARDFLVPSRLNIGSFYALPQSPQTYKQILMVAGYERYYQIAKCFRDEDLRADRQPEFTQIDCELSFVEEEAIYEIFEGMIAFVFHKALGIKIQVPIPRLTYDEAMDQYGTDKPDTRFDLKLIDVADIFKGTGFKVFRMVLENKGCLKAVLAKGCGDFTRKIIDDLTAFVGKYGARGLVWMRVTEKGVDAQIGKFLEPGLLDKLHEKLQAEPGDMIFIIAGNYKVTHQALSQLRIEVARQKNLIPTDQFNLLWITDFPMFEYSETDKRYSSTHHPFTAPAQEDESLLDSEENFHKARARAYDMVLNGNEIGGGSIRIHQSELQKKVFKQLGISPEEAKEKFGFLLDALNYGAPPHGGIAFGLDRLIMIMKNLASIREVIPFPKTSTGTSLMDNCPSPVSNEQLRELGIRLLEQK